MVVRLVLFTALVSLAIVVVACSDGDEDPDARLGQDSGGGGSPSTDLREVLATIPIFPGAELPEGAYPTGGSTGANLLTGFEVEDGTTVEDITSFFDEALREDGWERDVEATTLYGEKQGSVSETVAMTFVKDDVRLAVTIPLTGKKDAPPGVRTVNLQLAPVEIELLPDPDLTSASTPVETEDPAPSATSDAASGSRTPGPSTSP